MRHVFFSFDYADVWRANQVRNMWVTKGKKAAGFIDAAAFEKLQRRGDRAIKKWIDEQMHGTSVTVVLIGTKTLNRPYVQYEINQSIKKGKGLLGIHINELGDKNSETKEQLTSQNLDSCNDPPLGLFESILYDQKYETEMFPGPGIFGRTPHGWISDNIGNWIETAAEKVGR